MAESYSKPDKALYGGPVEELCGDPKDQSGGAGVTHGGDPVGARESGGVETVTYYNEPGKA